MDIEPSIIFSLVDKLMGEAGEDTFVFWSNSSGDTEYEDLLDFVAAEDHLKTMTS